MLLRFAWITRKKQSSGVVSCLIGLNDRLQAAEHSEHRWPFVVVPANDEAEELDLQGEEKA